MNTSVLVVEDEAERRRALLKLLPLHILIIPKDRYYSTDNFQDAQRYVADLLSKTPDAQLLAYLDNDFPAKPDNRNAQEGLGALLASEIRTHFKQRAYIVLASGRSLPAKPVDVDAFFLKPVDDGAVVKLFQAFLDSQKLRS